MAVMHKFQQMGTFAGVNLERRHSDSAPSSATSETPLPAGICTTHAAALNGEKQHLQKLVADSLHLTVDRFGRSALAFAVMGNQPDCVDLLLKAGLSADAADHAGRSALHGAAHRGYYTCLKLLVQRSSNPALPDQDKVTPCHLATQRGNNKCLPLLLKHLSSEALNAEDCNKRTPLHWAAAAGAADHVKALLRAGAQVLSADVEGKSPVHWAASCDGPQSPQAVKLLLEAEPKATNWQDFEGRTALHVAVADGHIKTVAVLLNNSRCNIHCLDHQFRSALHWAALLGLTETVELLVGRGARVAATDANGASPLHYAAQMDHKEVVAVLLRKIRAHEVRDLSGMSALSWAAGSGALGAIETMVARGGVLHLTDKRGETALFTACTCGQTAAAGRLLELGADPNTASRSGTTPLFGACANGHGDIVKLLLAHKADVNAADEEGKRPIHAAARFGHSYVVHILLDGGAAVDPVDRYGRTPLMHAAYAGYGDVLTLLAGYGAATGRRDVDGRSVLHWAAGRGQLDSVRVLLEQGAEPNHVARLSYLMTPLDCAVVGGHHEVASVLTEYGGVSIATIEDVASTKIQAAWRGHTIRHQFLEKRAKLLPPRDGERNKQSPTHAARGSRGATVADRRQSQAPKPPAAKPTASKPNEMKKPAPPAADSAIDEIVCSFLEHVVGGGGRPKRHLQLSARQQACAAWEYADQRLKLSAPDGDTGMVTLGPDGAVVARGKTIGGAAIGKHGRKARQGPPAVKQRKKSERHLEIPDLTGESTDEEEGRPQETAARTIQRAWRGHTTGKKKGKAPPPPTGEASNMAKKKSAAPLPPTGNQSKDSESGMNSPKTGKARLAVPPALGMDSSKLGHNMVAPTDHPGKRSAL
ncbi:inversin-like isoform X1 [Amphibalanus amphitrite]|nr:inversin-like isoform X1 [Amphibalanus amphitrite]